MHQRVLIMLNNWIYSSLEIIILQTRKKQLCEKISENNILYAVPHT